MIVDAFAVCKLVGPRDSCFLEFLEVIAALIQPAHGGRMGLSRQATSRRCHFICARQGRGHEGLQLMAYE